MERQYSYLHALEEKISRELGDEEIYRREGGAYAKDYPLFSDWAWVSYVFLFPVAALLATAVLQVFEWTGLAYPTAYKLFDSVMALGIAMSFYLYRVHPWLFAGRGSHSWRKEVGGDR